MTIPTERIEELLADLRRKTFTEVSVSTFDALEELLALRRAGATTPEAFVDACAARLPEVEGTHRADWLASLSGIEAGLRRIRQIEAHYMKERGPAK